MPKYKYKDFANTRTYTGVIKYSPDGQRIAHVTNETGQFNIWLINPDGTGKEPVTMYADNTIRSLEWSPDGKTILYNADQNGDEQHQIYLVDVATQNITALTQKLTSQHYIGAGFSPDGKYIAFSGNDNVPTNIDTLIYDVEKGEVIKRVEVGGLAIASDWSPDSRYISIVQVKSNTNQIIHLYDMENDSLQQVLPHDEPFKQFPSVWRKDGSGFFMICDQGREFSNLGFYNLKDDAFEWFATPDNDVEGVEYAKDADVLFWVINQDGRSLLKGRNLETGEDINIPEMPKGVVAGMSAAPDASKIALSFSHSGEAYNLYELDIEAGTFQAVGKSMLGGVDPDDMVAPELIHYETFDGKQIPAWLYKPKVGRAPHPVILSIHGGPEAQERPQYNYNGLYQYLLNLGFAILAPNIRGSTGYGISYQKLIHRDWGGDELKDIEHAAKYLQSLDWIDNNRIAVFGGSFGGFATLSAVTRLPDYWAAAVDIVGPFNLVTFAKAVPPTWRAMMKEWVGDPEEDYDFLMERSPISYVENVKVPMLVIQGAKDPRVVKNESDQLVEKLRENGVKVKYYVDEEEGHGATRKANSIKWNNMVTDFLEAELLDEPSES